MSDLQRICTRSSRRWEKVDFDGVLIADHRPVSAAGPLVSQAYTIGYIQSLIERANEEFRQGS